MTSYVEQATLRVRDESTRNIRKINREMRRLMTTLQSASDVRMRITGLSSAKKEVRELNELIGKIPTMRKVTITGLRKALTELRTFRQGLTTIPKTQRVTVGINRVGEVTRQIGKIRTQLEGLHKFAGKNVSVRVSLPGATPAITKLKEIQRLLNAVNGRAVTPRVNAPPTPRIPAVPRAPRGPLGPTPPGMGPLLGGASDWGRNAASSFRAQLRPEMMGRNIARGMAYAVAGELYMAGRETVRAAAVAPIDLDSARARVRIAGRTEEELAILEGLAGEMTQRFTATTKASLLAASGEFTGRFGDFSEPGVMEKVEASMERYARNAQVLAAALNLDPARAAEQARILESTIQQTGAASDPERAQRISEAGLQAIIASGGDLQAPDAKRTLQQVGALRAGLSENTLRQILLARDEGGRRSTGSFRQAFSDLFRTTLSAEAFGKQVAHGLRDKDGRSLVEDEFQEDFLNSFIIGEIIPRLQANDPDIDLGDAGDIRAGLGDLGFIKEAGVGLMTGAIMHLDELLAEDQRALMTNPDFAITDPSARQEIAAVKAQFSNVAAEVLDPLVEPAKQGLSTISDSLANIAAGEAGITDYGAIAAAAAPVALFAGVQAMSSDETRPLGAAGLALTGSATALTGAATALTAAAAAQGAAGVAGGVGGRGGRRGGMLGPLARWGAVGAAAYAVHQAGKEGEERKIELMSQGVPEFEAENIVLTERREAIEDSDFAANNQVRELFGLEALREPKLPGSAGFVGEMLGFERSPAGFAADAAEVAKVELGEEFAHIGMNIERNIAEPIRQWAVDAGQDNPVAEAALMGSAVRETVPREGGFDAGNLESFLSIGTTPEPELLSFGTDEPMDFGSGEMFDYSASIIDSAEQVAPTVAEGMAAVASQIGQAIGRAAAAEIETARVSVSGGGVGPDTGSPPPDVGPSIPS